MKAQVNIQSVLEEDRLARSLLAGAIIAGLVFRTWQFFAIPSLWLDELAALNGPLNGPPWRLFTGPLDFGQLAPSGFLFAEWLVHRAAGHSELALRMLPMAMGCGSVVVTALLVKEVVGIRYAWIATTIVALSGPLIGMSATLKPYSGDVFLTALIALLAVREHQHGTRAARLALATTMTLAPWFSYSAGIGSAGVAALIGWRVLRGSADERRAALTMLTPWVISMVATFLVSRQLMSQQMSSWVSDTWGAAFPSLVPRSLRDAMWPVIRIQRSMWSVAWLRPGLAFALAGIAGLVVLWFRNGRNGRIVVAPLIAVFGAAYAQLYPVTGRVAHWMIPIIAIALTALVAFVAERAGRFARVATLVLGAGVVASPVITLASGPPPYVLDDVRPMLEHINAEAKEGDMLYVFYGAWHSWQVYGRRVAPTLGVMMGGCPRDYPRGYLYELDSLRGRESAWVLFARVYEREVRDAMVAYLDSAGTRLYRRAFVPYNLSPSAAVELYRYDLSDPAKFEAANASTFPIAVPTEQREACMGMDVMLRRADGARVVRMFGP